MRKPSSFTAFLAAIGAAFVLVSALPIVQPLSSAIVVVQTNGASGTANSAVSTGVDTTGATLLLMGCAWIPDPTANITASDSKTNTWVGLTASTYSIYTKVRWFYVNSATPTVGASHTFTCAGTSTYATVAYLAASGAHATPFDQENGNAANATGCSGAPIASCDHNGGFTPVENAEIVLAGISSTNGITTTTINGGFTTIYIHDADTAQPGGFAYLIQTTAAAVNPVWSFTNAGSEVMSTALASFKVAATAGPFKGSRALLGVGR